MASGSGWNLWNQMSSILFNFAQVQIMDDNCGEWVECMSVASGWG